MKTPNPDHPIRNTLKHLARTPRWLLRGISAFTALTAMHASADFTAYNDCTDNSAGNPANTTLYRGNATTSGFLALRTQL